MHQLIHTRRGAIVTHEGFVVGGSQHAFAREVSGLAGVNITADYRRKSGDDIASIDQPHHVDTGKRRAERGIAHARRADRDEPARCDQTCIQRRDGRVEAMAGYDQALEGSLRVLQPPLELGQDAARRARESLMHAVNRSKDVTPSKAGNRRQSTNRPSKVATLRQI